MSIVIQEPCVESFVRSAPATSPCTKESQRWVLAATILGTSLAFIDGTVVNVALPVLQRELNATLVDVQWVIESYSLLLSALLLVGGSLGDRYGRRRVFIIGTIIFALASAGCGLATGIQPLNIARAVQGFGAALLVPGSLAIISSSFHEEDRGRAIGTWSAFTAITTALGPVVGGWLIQQFSWRAVFFINVPLAILVVVICYWRVPESSGPKTGGLDWTGAILITLGLSAVVYGLVESSRLGFRNPTIATALISGSLLLITFVVFEARASNPMLPLDLFRSRSFTGANLLTLFLYGAFGATLFFLPLNLIQVQHYPPTSAGAALLPLILIIFLLSRWSGGLVARHGAKIPLFIGSLIASVGFLLFGLLVTGGSYWKTYFLAAVALGTGMAIAVPPLTTTIMNSVTPARVGVASGINNAVSRVAGLLAIAVLGIVISQVFTQSLETKLRDLPASLRQSIEGQASKLAAADIPENLTPAKQSQLRAALDGSFIAGFRVVMFVCVVLSIGSASIALWLIDSNATRAAPANKRSRPIIE